MAAAAGDVATLARKLRGKGLDDKQVTEGLQGMGFSKTEATQAIRGLSPAAPPAKKPPAGRGRERKPGDTQAAPDASPPPAAPATSSGTSFSPPSLNNITLTPPKKLGAGDLGGFLAGLLVYTVALNYIRSGPDGVTSWIKAKFLNQPNEDLADTPARGKKAQRSFQIGDQPATVTSGLNSRGLTDIRPPTPEPV